MKETFNLIKYKFEHGVYSLKKVMEFVELQWITKEQFKQITSYCYDGIKNVGIDNSIP